MDMDTGRLDAPTNIIPPRQAMALRRQMTLRVPPPPKPRPRWLVAAEDVGLVVVAVLSGVGVFAIGKHFGVW